MRDRRGQVCLTITRERAAAGGGPSVSATKGMVRKEIGMDAFAQG